MRTAAPVPNPRSEAGAALLVAMLVLFVAVTLGMTSARVASTEVELAGNYAQSWRAFYAADGAAQASFNDLLGVARSLGRFPEESELQGLAQRELGGIDFTRFRMVPTGEAAEQPLSAGFYQGMVAATRPYEVELVAETERAPRAEAGVTMGMFFDIIPIFQFAVFYEHDLELLPGPPMGLAGRVHANADVYLGAGESLRIDSNVTAAGSIRNRRKDTVVQPPGAVSIRDGQGAFPAMAGLGADDPDWQDQALARWRGNVRDRDHGIERLNLTIADPGNPRMIIEPGYASDGELERSTKLYYRAQMNVNIINGQGFDPDGNRLDLGNAVDFDTLYDHREQKDVLLVEVDVSKLNGIRKFPPPGEPAVVYIGSFEPGDGMPAWEIIEGVESGPAPFEDWLEWLEEECGDEGDRSGSGDSRSGSGRGGGGGGGSCGLLNLMQDVEESVSELQEECAESPPDLREANKEVRAAEREVRQAERRGLLEPETAAALVAWLAPMRSCVLAGVDEVIPELVVDGGDIDVVDWPSPWGSKQPPYRGGNTIFAVKIENGALLRNPLTIVTANAAYIQGDYNVIDKKPAAVLADAVTILSNGWSDADSVHSRLDLDVRQAADTTMNVALMLGNTETTLGAYNGGVENVTRFLENWTGRTFTYRGSLIDLWHSQEATGAWKYGTPVYTAPQRDWEFDRDLLDPAKLPPSTPRVYTLRLKEWVRSS